MKEKSCEGKLLLFCASPLVTRGVGRRTVLLLKIPTAKGARIWNMEKAAELSHRDEGIMASVTVTELSPCKVHPSVQGVAAQFWVKQFSLLLVRGKQNL